MCYFPFSTSANLAFLIFLDSLPSFRYLTSAFAFSSLYPSLPPPLALWWCLQGTLSVSGPANIDVRGLGCSVKRGAEAFIIPMLALVRAGDRTLNGECSEKDYRTPLPVALLILAFKGAFSR